MISIGVALPRPCRMDMHIRHDRETACLADRPKLAEVPSIKSDNASVQRMRIEIVVKHEINDMGATTFAATEQKRSTLPAATTPTLAQPHLQAATETRSRTAHAAGRRGGA